MPILEGSRTGRCARPSQVFAAALAVVAVLVSCAAFAWAQPIANHSIGHAFSRNQIVIGLPDPSKVRGLLVRRDSEIDGFAKRIAEEAAGAVGISVTFKEVEGNGNAALQSGEIDLLVPTSVTSEYLNTLVYTSPLIVTRGAIYSRPGRLASPDVEGLQRGRVVVAGAGIAHQWCIERDVNCTPLPTLRAAVEAVNDGTADFVITTLIAGRVELEQLGITGLEEHELRDEEFWRAFAMAAPMSSGPLIADMDNGLAILRDRGRYDALYDEWLGRLQPRQVASVFTRANVAWAMGAVGTVALVGLFAYAVSQRRLAQRTASLRATEARFRVLFEESPDGVMVLDPRTLAPVEFNSAMSELLDRQPDELLRGTIAQWCAEWDDPRHQEEIRKTVESGSGDFDTRVRRADGRIIDVRCRVRTIVFENKPFLQAIFRDITASKKAREAVERERRLFIAGPVVCFRSRSDGAGGLAVEHVSENIRQFGHSPEDLLTGRVQYLSLIHPEDIDRVIAEADRHVNSGDTHFFQEYRLRTGDGRWVWLADYTTIVRGEAGQALYFEGYIIDTTQQKDAADSIRESEARYRAIVENTPALIFSYFVDAKGVPQLRVVNSQLRRWQETFPWLVVGKDYRETIRPYIHPDDVETYDAEVARARRDRDRFEIEFRLKSRTGEYRSLHSIAISLEAEGGIQWQSMLVDVTELRRASEAARRSEERYREIFQRSHDAIVVFRPEDELILDANERALKLYGYTRAEFVGKSFGMVSLSDERSRSAIEKTVHDGVFTDSAWRQRRRDGSLIHVDVVSSVIDYEGTRAIVSLNRDVTGRVKAESALSESERRYRSFVQHSSEGVWCIDFPVTASVTLPVDEQIRLLYEHGVVSECNDAMARMYGLQRAEQLLGSRLADLMPAHDPHNIEYLRSIIHNGYRIEEAESHEVDAQGQARVFLNSVICVIEDGRIVRAWGIQRDITAKKVAESALAEARERLRLAVLSADLGTWTFDLRSNQVEGDPRYLSFFGIAPHAGPLDSQVFRSMIHADDRPRVEQALADAAAGEGVYRIEYRLLLPDGRVRWLSSRGALRRDRDGTPQVIAGASMDITDARVAAEERERLAEQLRQAQKLESLGVMAGGIAHDFNNLLVAIMGNAGLALKSLPPDSDAHRGVSRIEQAATRASELTRQLLTYAGRDQADPEPIDISSVVREMAEIVEVSIDRSASLSLELAPDLPHVMADPTQCRQVVMNLLSNASEALEGRAGKIHVRTFPAHLDIQQLAELHTQGCAEPGPFVCFEVADTGCGMPQAVRVRIFEPFFTTKFTGRGLGLTAVLGIVRKHGGAIGIESAPGAGTIFRVYLPAAPAPREAQPAPARPPVSSSGSGTILVIDDEAMVRDVARMCLEDAGFRVVSIPDGPQAITLAQDHSAQFDGILLDMTMPSMSGPEVFAELRKLRGNVPVLLTSGYAEENAAEQLLAEPKVGFIQKPYRPVQLIKAIQDLIATGA